MVRRPPIYDGTLPPFDQSVVKNEIAPTIRSLAKELELEFLEFHDRLVNEGQYFPDGIHPNGTGTALMASTASEVIGHFNADAPTALIFTVSSSRMGIEWLIHSPGYVLQECESLSQDASDWKIVRFTAPKHKGSVICAEPRKRGTAASFAYGALNRESLAYLQPEWFGSKG